MLVLGLITCIVLRALSAQAKVVHSFEECKEFKEFLYQGTEPRGMDQNAEKICQKLENSERFYYATLYSVHHKIPLYSAYTLDLSCSADTTRPNTWHLEPQLSQPQSRIDYMVRENQNTQDLYKGNQAISSDYSGTGYDRGHLNPSSFQCKDGRKATFTLTNAAPMDACFNRIHWKSWESKLRRYLLRMLDRDGKSAKAFIVTGTVLVPQPDPNVRTPNTGTSEDPPRVSVPSHIWTAVCYKHTSDDTKSLSFGYIGKNLPAEPDIRLMSVSDLNGELNRLYGWPVSSIERTQLERHPTFSETFIWDYNDPRLYLETHQSIEIFVDDCFGDNNKLNKVKEVFKKIPVNQAVQMSSGIQNTYQAVNRAVRSDSTPIYNNNNIRISEMTVKLAFDSMSTYYNVAEDLKIFAGSACPITYTKPLVRKFVHDELRKREVSVGSDAVECQLVSEKQTTAADGSSCSSVTETDDSCQCNTEGKTKPCCSTPCIYQDELKGYRCYSDQKLIECSPRYSLITYKGQRCLDDHPCATYGYDYYWCKTANSWDYCSPPLRNSKTINGKYCRSNHACANYGYKYKWCYTDDEGNSECCTSDDCYSALNGQSCRSDHPCGYHGEYYLWCYTDQKHWNYCCTNCG